MIGTHTAAADTKPRMLRSEFGWWFLGNGTWTLLRPEHVNAEGNIIERIDKFLIDSGAYAEPPTSSEIFSLTVMTTTNCNLGCGYCYQNTALDPTGGHRTVRIPKTRLNTEGIDRIFRFAQAQVDAAGLKGIHLGLYGGEPLMNPQACLQLLDRGRANANVTSASMVSNGVLLKPRLAKQLSDAGLRHVQITFDGCRADHDTIRVKRSGAPTFDIIVNNLVAAETVSDLRWNFRVNVSHHNFDRIAELFGDLDGFVDPTQCSIHFAWVGDNGFGYENTLNANKNVADRFADITIQAIEAGYKLSRPSMARRCQTCSIAGGRYGAVIGPEGTIYSCWQSGGKPDMAVGNVDTGYTVPVSDSSRWVQCAYEYEHSDLQQQKTIQDTHDARVLDHIYRTGRL